MVGAFEVEFLFYLLMRLNNSTWVSRNSRDEVAFGSALFPYSLCLSLSSVDQSFITLDMPKSFLLFGCFLLKKFFEVLP